MRDLFLGSVISVMALGLALPSGVVAEPSLRIRVIEQTRSVMLSGQALRIQNRLVPERALRATAARGEVRVGPLASREPVWVEGAGGVVVDGSRYPGGLALLPRADGMDVLNVVPLEAYVERSVAREIYGDWPREVLKAQAVITRTYALYEKDRRSGAEFDLEASVISQRYTGGAVPSQIQRAVEETRGEFLSFSGGPILAAFHSSAGGRTASAQEVWGTDLPYLRTVSSPDEEAPEHFWSFEISMKDLRQAMKKAGFSQPSSSEPRVLERSPSGRVDELLIGGVGLSGRELRQILGGRAIHSALFEVRVDGKSVRFLGSGSGHGVGLSQWGARELARRGRSYPEILAHYYPGAELGSLAPGADQEASR